MVELTFEWNKNEFMAWKERHVSLDSVTVVDERSATALSWNVYGNWRTWLTNKNQIFNRVMLCKEIIHPDGCYRKINPDIVIRTYRSPSISFWIQLLIDGNEKPAWMSGLLFSAANNNGHYLEISDHWMLTNQNQVFQRAVL